jgi:hypothetical protein
MANRLCLDPPLELLAQPLDRSIAFMVLANFHRPGGSRVKANSRSPVSSRLSATA